MGNFTEHLLCARFFSNNCSYINIFNLHNNPIEWVLLISSFYKRGARHTGVRLAPGHTAGRWWSLNLNPSSLGLGRTEGNTLPPFSCLYPHHSVQQDGRTKEAWTVASPSEAGMYWRSAWHNGKTWVSHAKRCTLQPQVHRALESDLGQVTQPWRVTVLGGIGWRPDNLWACYEQNDVPSPKWAQHGSSIVVTIIKEGCSVWSLGQGRWNKNVSSRIQQCLEGRVLTLDVGMGLGFSTANQSLVLIVAFSIMAFTLSLSTWLLCLTFKLINNSVMVFIV